jgi:hypothetical protein
VTVLILFLFVVFALRVAIGIVRRFSVLIALAVVTLALRAGPPHS